MRLRYFAILATTILLATASCGGTTVSSPLGSAFSTNGSAHPIPTHAQIAKWPSAWCSVSPGVPLSKLESAMGPPTETRFQHDPTNPQVAWDAFDWHFNAFLDMNGNVHQMDINDISLTQSERSQITCDTTRIAP